MAEVGYATLAIIPSFSNFRRDLERGSASGMTAAGRSGGARFGDAAGDSAGKRFGGKFSAAMKVGLLGAVTGAAGTLKVLGDSVKAASDLGETMSKTSQIFGSEALPALQKFAKGASKSLGQSQQSALDAISTFGVFGKSAGLRGPELQKFSTKLTSLASDMASFSNTSPDQAIEAIGAALRGEAEPIRQYGVLLDEATLKAEALRLGILKPVKDKNKILSAQARLTESQAKYNEAVTKSGKDSLDAIKAQGQLGYAQSALQKATDGTVGPLNQQQKVLAAQSAIFKQTSDQQGDFARTSDGLANKQRILSAEWANAKTRLGSGLLPIVTRFASVLADDVIPAIGRAASWIRDKWSGALSDSGGMLSRFVGFLVTKLFPAVKDFAGKVIAGAVEGFQNFKQALGENKPFIDQVVKALGKFGTFMVEKVLPALGEVYRVALPALGTAFGKAITFTKLYAATLLLIGEFGARGFRLLLSSALTTFDGIVSAAAAGLGWIPGIGDKVKAANKAFDRFRDSTISKLDAIADSARRMREAITAPATLPINVKFITSAANNVERRLNGARANGGPVSAGGTYLVGERGPEVVTFGQSGNVTPNHQLGGKTYNVTVVADDPWKWKRDMEHMERSTSMGAESFR